MIQLKKYIDLINNLDIFFTFEYMYVFIYCNLLQTFKPMQLLFVLNNVCMFSKPLLNTFFVYAFTAQILQQQIIIIINTKNNSIHEIRYLKHDKRIL